MRPPLVLEALCGSAEDVAAAAEAGATRAELCASLGAGGLTPSPGTVALAARAGIPVMAMLRPRIAGFCYSTIEAEVMERDAEALAAAGAGGLVFGHLKADGRVDTARCAALMRHAPGLEWVFHRAFDLVPEPLEALEELIGLGLTRVLTKGQANSFEEGEDLLLALKEKARGRIEILIPGVRPHNVARIVGQDGFDQIHFGRSLEAVDPSNGAKPEVYFGLATKGREHLYEAFDKAYFSEIRDLALAARA